ncbi:hypothetical protein BJY01DRAFT_242910 [Aspergillus pseudoustus]|uniref:Uncharacterized protein n=1 Tax=Aspergillus pseudoustus TaxID=1810923 RepID=A0ABR4KUN0_9EURO
MQAGDLDCYFCSPFLVNAVLAVACSYSKLPGTKTRVGTTLPGRQAFYSEAKRLLDIEHGKLPLTTFQGRGDLHLSMWAMGKHMLGWQCLVEIASCSPRMISQRNAAVAKPDQKSQELARALETAATGACTALPEWCRSGVIWAAAELGWSASRMYFRGGLEERTISRYIGLASAIPQCHDNGGQLIQAAEDTNGPNDCDASGIGLPSARAICSLPKTFASHWSELYIPIPFIRYANLALTTLLANPLAMVEPKGREQLQQYYGNAAHPHAKLKDVKIKFPSDPLVHEATSEIARSEILTALGERGTRMPRGPGDLSRQDRNPTRTSVRDHQGTQL